MATLDAGQVLTSLVNLGAAGVLAYLAIQRMDTIAGRLDDVHGKLLAILERALTDKP